MHWRVGASCVLALGCGPSAGTSSADGTGTTSGSETSAADADGTPTGADTGIDPTPTTVGPGSTSVADSTSTAMPGTSSTDDGGSESTGDPIATGLHRVLIFYTPNGYYQSEAWSGQGENFLLGSMLAPLEPWSDDLVLVAGMRNIAIDPDGVDVEDAHSMASASLLTGGLIGSGSQGDSTSFNPHYAGGPSLDVAVGDALPQTTAFSALHLGVRQSATPVPLGVSYLGLDEPNDPVLSPSLAFEQVFGGLPLPEELQPLEDQVAAVSDGNPVEVLDAHAAIATAALSYDLTRSVLVSVDIGVAQIIWEPLGIEFFGFHDVLMENHPPMTQEVFTYFGQTVAAMASQLAEAPAPGGGTMLDHTLIVWMSEMGSVPAAHTRDGVLTIILDASGTFATGQVVDLEALDVDTADLGATIGAALGVDLGDFGHPSLAAAVVPALLAD